MRVARELGTKEGILGGISSGAIVCDFGERYISTLLYEDIRG